MGWVKAKDNLDEGGPHIVSHGKIISYVQISIRTKILKTLDHIFCDVKPKEIRDMEEKL